MSARPDRAAELWRSMFSDEGGVGTVSSRVRRARSSRGAFRIGAGAAFLTARLGAAARAFGARLAGRFASRDAAARFLFAPAVFARRARTAPDRPADPADPADRRPALRLAIV